MSATPQSAIRNPQLSRRAVLLDRDGTLNVERCYLSDPAELELLPGVAAALVRLQSLGLPLVVVTNQSGVGRGMFSLEDVARVHARLRELLACAGVELAGIYFCPHVAADGCQCRKPATGLVEQAARELNIAPHRSFLVGDKSADIELGRRVGATTLLVRTGYGREYEQQGATADYIVDDLPAAAEVIARLVESDPSLHAR